MEHYIIPPDQFHPANAYREWKTILEVANTDLGLEARVSAWDQCDYKNTLKILRAIVKHRSATHLYLWLHDIWETATKGAVAAFEAAQVNTEDVPGCIQYWSFNIDTSLNEVGQKDLNISSDFTIAGMFLVPTALISGKTSEHETDQPAFVSGLLLQPSAELSNRMRIAAEAGKPLPPEEWIFRFRFSKPVQSNEIVPYEERSTLAAIRFLKEKFVDPRQQFLPRAEKRRERKEKLSIPEIRSVLLRARADDAIDNLSCVFDFFVFI